MPKTISYTIQAVTANELKEISITRQTDGAGGVVLVATGAFDMKAAGGNVVGSGSVSLQLTPAQKTAIAGFATSALVPAFNAQEGL